MPKTAGTLLRPGKATPPDKQRIARKIAEECGAGFRTTSLGTKMEESLTLNHANAQFLKLAVLICIAGGAALAQVAPGGGQQPQRSIDPTAGNPGAYPVGGATDQTNLADQLFITKAMEGNDTEVQLSQLAQQKSASADVKQYAQKVASEHQQMNDKWLKPVARQLGASEPKGPSKKEKKEIAKLDGLSGPQFDSEYIQTMMADYQKDLKDYKDEAGYAQDPNVKQIAQQAQPLITTHLELAEQLAKSHNVEASGAANPKM